MTGKFYLNAIFFDEIDNQPLNIKKIKVLSAAKLIGMTQINAQEFGNIKAAFCHIKTNFCQRFHVILVDLGVEWKLKNSDNITILAHFWVNQGRIIFKSSKKNDRTSNLIDQLLQLFQ